MNVIRPKELKRDFTLLHYREMLKAMTASHKIISFKEASHLGPDILKEDRLIILRHDVEFSLRGALCLAEENHAAGVCATFFLLHSSDYNIFEEEGAKIVRKILDLGHNIGLHYDAALMERLGVEARDVAQKQISLMEAYWNTRVYAMSSHMPMRSNKTFSVPGVIDVYDPLYMKEIKYISDSTQCWREDVVTRLLDKYPGIHLLIHDYYWTMHGLNWDTLLLDEAKSKFDAFWSRAHENILRYRKGLGMRSEKDKKFQKRY